MEVINLTRLVQTPDVVLEDGQRTGIRLYPRARVKLGAGQSIDSNWLARNPKVLRVIAPAAPVVKHKQETGDK